jgi:hypothetical protein
VVNGNIPRSKVARSSPRKLDPVEKANARSILNDLKDAVLKNDPYAKMRLEKFRKHTHHD